MVLVALHSAQKTGERSGGTQIIQALSTQAFPRNQKKLAMVVHICIRSTQETEARELKV
ncbi:hypothetical protein I79_005609 [Cricetulus griseus]|uniref:Uncharacterized protein n=1 Tax=Cricetulus griseus TaxID=10029 RepID=G3H5M4_CRIGR|nr:hypothetical protein I79_005609 [Cricetulus griseus]